MSESPRIPAAGLCATCRHAEILRSKRSAFLRCGRAASDARFPRYPPLPVFACSGFEVPEGAVSEMPKPLGGSDCPDPSEA